MEWIREKQEWKQGRELGEYFSSLKQRGLGYDGGTGDWGRGLIEGMFVCRANRIVKDCILRIRVRGGVKDDAQGFYLRCW